MTGPTSPEQSARPAAARRYDPEVGEPPLAVDPRRCGSLINLIGGLVFIGSNSSAFGAAACSTCTGRPGRSKSCKAATPPVSYRPRHNNTVGRLTPTFSAIAVLLIPSAASNTIRALLANPDLNTEARNHPSKVRRSVSRTASGATRIEMPHGPKDQP